MHCVADRCQSMYILCNDLIPINMFPSTVPSDPYFNTVVLVSLTYLTPSYSLCNRLGIVPSLHPYHNAVAHKAGHFHILRTPQCCCDFTTSYHNPQSLLQL
jgi:hypothetical protein